MCSLAPYLPKGHNTFNNTFNNKSLEVPDSVCAFV